MPYNQYCLKFETRNYNPIQMTSWTVRIFIPFLLHCHSGGVRDFHWIFGLRKECEKLITHLWRNLIPRWQGVDAGGICLAETWYKSLHSSTWQYFYDVYMILPSVIIMCRFVNSVTKMESKLENVRLVTAW